MSFGKLMEKFGNPLGTPQDIAELDVPSPKLKGLDSFINRFTGMTNEDVWLYNGTVHLKLNKDHVYFLVDPVLGNLKEVDGVTNTTKIINASEQLVPWAAKVAIAKLLRLVPTEMIEGILRIKPITFDEFTVIALEAKSAHKDELDKAGDIGHLAHKCLEDSITYALQTDPEKIVKALINLPQDERALTAANSAFVWMQAHNVRWIQTETKVYSKEYNYAGTMDGKAVCDSCQDKACCQEQFKDRLSVIDWKSSNYLNIGYIFQAASYKHADQEEHGVPIADVWILRLGKSEDEAGKFEPWHMGPEDFADDFAGFLACLSLSRLVKSVKERMDKQRADIRFIRKEQKETAKALAKEQEKLAKAIAKAEAKQLKEIEKKKTQEEAKIAREKAKAEKKALPVVAAVEIETVTKEKLD
jgi:hypothetical protein